MQITEYKPDIYSRMLDKLWDRRRASGLPEIREDECCETVLMDFFSDELRAEGILPSRGEYTPSFDELVELFLK